MAHPGKVGGLGWLREAAWLTAGRAALYGGLLALVPASYLAVALWRMTGEAGRVPAGMDFAAFYAASALTLDGAPAAAWDRVLHAAAHGTSPEAGYFPFLYPPTFLFICLPLALLPFAGAFFAWVMATAAACVATLSAYGAARWPIIALLCLLAPAAVQNVANGQNAFFTTALFAAAGLAMDRRPGLAGTLFALLAFKPQLGLLVLPGLLAAGRWRVVAWGSVAAVLLVLASVAAFGLSAWAAFIAGMPMVTDALAEGRLPLWQMQSTFAMLRVQGVGLPQAYAAQALVTAAAIVILVVALRRRPGGRAEIAAMTAGAPLATPYVFAYDLTLLLLPAVWLWSEARRGGFLPWEKIGLVLIVVAPGCSIAIGLAWGVSIGPVVALLAFALVVRRIRTMDAAGRPPS